MPTTIPTSISISAISRTPSDQPSSQPSSQPSVYPTSFPTKRVVSTNSPSFNPTVYPGQPTPQPTAATQIIVNAYQELYNINCTTFNTPYNLKTYINVVQISTNLKNINIKSCVDNVNGTSSNRRHLTNSQNSIRVIYEVIIVAEGAPVPAAIYNATIHTMQVYMTGSQFLTLLTTGSSSYNNVVSGPVQGNGYTAMAMIYPTMAPTDKPSRDSSISSDNNSFIILYTTIAGTIGATLGILYKLYQFRSLLFKLFRRICSCFFTNSESLVDADDADSDSYSESESDNESDDNKNNNNPSQILNVAAGGNNNLSNEKVDQLEKGKIKKKKKEEKDTDKTDGADDNDSNNDGFLMLINACVTFFSFICNFYGVYYLIKKTCCDCFQKPQEEDGSKSNKSKKSSKSIKTRKDNNEELNNNAE
jgi:hypothetical protein